MTVLVTGATGLVGAVIARRLMQDGLRLRLALRSPDSLPVDLRVAQICPIGDLQSAVDWGSALERVSAVIHCAGLAHQPRGADEAQLVAVNADAAGLLARQARQAGVAHFIHISSVRALCGPSASETIGETHQPAPLDAYGRSKRAGEEAVLDAGLAGAILRPPLIIDGAARGNFGRLMRLSAGRLPLPFAGLTAPRSILAAASLADAVAFLLARPPSPMETMLIAEDRPLSTAAMIGHLRRAAGRRAALYSAPATLLQTMIARMLSPEAWESLSRPLVLNPSRLTALGWQPRGTAEGALIEAMRTFLARGGR
jgi:nucleoside-diphosphate-sugar epimerase